MLLLATLTTAAAPAAPTQPATDARQAWQLLDYIAVDYAGAVRNGQVLSEGEYAEMREFARTIQTRLEALPPSPGREERLAAAARLVGLVDRKAAPTDVAAAAQGLADGLLKAYPIETAPPSTPDLARAAGLYAQTCASCHGAKGAGDGPAAASLDPKPVAFTDHDRARQRTPLALFQVISQGVSGTAMPSFAQLPDADRWSLAFYVGGLSYDEPARDAGRQAWASANARNAVGSLEALAQSSEAQLSTRVGEDAARAITAYLRAHPDVPAQTAAAGQDAHPLALARQRLGEAVAAYGRGDAREAQRLALSAYLDGVEPVEPTLAARDPARLREIEAAMAALRSDLARGASLSDIQSRQATLTQVFDRSEAVLVAKGGNAIAAFLGSMTILLREGLEALLIVVGMIAFLRKADRAETLRYVHAGWIIALLGGVLTWAVATRLVSISGAHREVTEGVSSLFAAIVLLSVGIWMHQKSLAGRWQEYLHARLSHALTRRSAVFLFLLSFIAVYREVFETILFYAAMWNDDDRIAILAGLGVGTAALGAVAFVLLRLGTRLPIGSFFKWSSILIAVLATVLVGKGVAALQEAGWISQATAIAPRIDWLGVFPTWQSLCAQLAVLAIAIAGFYWNSRPRAGRASGRGA